MPLTPAAPEPTRGPSLARLLGEATTPAQAARLWRHRRRLRAARHDLAASGSSTPVVDIPGYFTPELAMAPLRAYLRWLGHDVQGWGLGHNTSQVVDKVRAFVPLVRDLAEQRQAPVDLIGYSLGGLVAREVARDAPDAVGRVVTFGAPVIGGPRWTNARFGYSPAAVRRFQAAADARSVFPIKRPITSIVSRRDGVIHWHAQIDRHSPDVQHVEVRSPHVGMGVDPDVWLATARALA